MQIPKKNRDASLPKAALVVLLLVVALSARSQSDESRSGQWRIAGQNLSNSWSQPAEHSISPANVNGLAPKWVFTTGGDYYWISSHIRGRGLHWNFFDRRNSGTESSISVLQLPRECRGARCEDRSDALEDVRHA